MSDDAIRRALGTIEVPAPETVVGFEVRTGKDSTGDPAVWVFVVVRDDQTEKLWPSWDQLREDIRAAVAEAAGPDIVTYVRMWAASEVEAKRAAAP